MAATVPDATCRRADACWPRTRCRVLRSSPSAVTTPLVPADYLDLIDPLRSGADLRGRIVAVAPGDPRRRHPGASGPGAAGAGTRPASTSASASTSTASASGAPTRSPRRSAGPTAASPSPSRRSRTAWSATTSCTAPGPGRSSTSTRPPATSSCPAAAAGQGPVRHRRQRHHPGDGHAAQRARPALDDVVLVHSAPTPDDVIFGAELRALAATGRIRLVERHTDTDGMLDAARARRAGPRPGRARDLGLRPDRHARRARGALRPTAASPTGCTPSASGPPCWSPARAAPSPSPAPARPSTADGATPMLDAGEDAGVLMPSGCRMGICFGCVAAAARGRRARPAHRRAHHRRRPATACSSRPASAPPPAPADRPLTLPHRPTDRDSRSRHDRPAEEAREPDRPPDRRGHRDPRRGARRDPRGGHRQPRRARRRLHPHGHRRPAQGSSWAAAPCCWSRCSRRRGSSAPSACRSPRSSRTWRSATTSCTASGTGCATRRSTRPRGSGTTPPPPSSGSTRTTSCTTRTPT